jgi:hypothetical protein
VLAPNDAAVSLDHSHFQQPRPSITFALNIRSPPTTLKWVSTDAHHPSPEMANFQQLPRCIRLEILRYLLLADRVRQPPNHLLVKHYIFEVKALRVSALFNKDGKQILYGENRFVKVQDVFANFKMSPQEEKSMEDAMHNHEVPFFRPKGKFDNHVAEVTAKPHDMNQRRMAAGPKKSFLVLLQDMPKYTRLLRLMDLANFMGFCIDFKLHQHALMSMPLPIADQEKLLIPFERVRGTAL